MKIGELARRSGLTGHTIRYYERIGLLPRAPRDRAGRRDYDAAILDWIEFLGRLKTTGMPIREMLVYARLRAEGASTAGATARAAGTAPRRRAPALARASGEPRSPSTRRSPATPAQPRTNRAMTNSTKPNDERFERGARALAAIDGHGGQKVVDALADVAPDFARYLFEFPFGDIYSRPGSACASARSRPSPR